MFVDQYVDDYRVERDSDQVLADDPVTSEKLSSIFCVVDMYAPEEDRLEYELDEAQLRDEVRKLLEGDVVCHEREWIRMSADIFYKDNVIHANEGFVDLVSRVASHRYANTTDPWIEQVCAAWKSNIDFGRGGGLSDLDLDELPVLKKTANE